MTNFSEKLQECIENEFTKYPHKTTKEKYHNFLLLSYILSSIEGYEQTQEAQTKINSLKE